MVKGRSETYLYKGLLWSDWSALGVGLTILVVLLIGSFFSKQTTRSEEQIGRLLEKPKEFYGKEIDLTGEIEEIVGNRTFTLDSPDEFNGSLLVISRESLEPIGGAGASDFIFDEGERVSIKGRVEEFRVREVEERLRIDLKDEEFSSWEGKPVIIADTVQTNR